MRTGAGVQGWAGWRGVGAVEGVYARGEGGHRGVCIVVVCGGEVEELRVGVGEGGGGADGAGGVEVAGVVEVEGGECWGGCVSARCLSRELVTRKWI